MLGDFAGYKVFLDPWNPLAEHLRVFYEGLALRRDSRVLAVHGPQGTGKTMFATKLQSDFVASKERGSTDQPDAANLWHRITGGATLSRDAIVDANLLSDVLLIENQRHWVASTAEWLKHRTDRRCVIIADNAERSYFRQGLVDVSDAEYVTLANDPALTAMAAQRLVEHCREGLRGALFLVLSNDDMFLLNLDEAVQAQHNGLMTLTELPLPDKAAKETVVRVNTNRLNNVSYWYCVDKAGPQQKRAIKQALEGASNFPDSFAAVDNGLRTADPSRTGRPAKKNVISLMVCTDQTDLTEVDAQNFGSLLRTEVEHEWLASYVFSEDWAPDSLGTREAALLESEWMLRVVVLGRPFVHSLVEVAEDDVAFDHIHAVRSLLGTLETFHGPGAWPETRAKFTSDLKSHVDQWPQDVKTDVDAFWRLGQTRSTVYEKALRSTLPGYNSSAAGFLQYRPDFIVNPFRPCSVVSAISNEIDAINSTIRREAHVFEFTAIKAYSDAKVSSYLASKLPNYVQVTQEQ